MSQAAEKLMAYRTSSDCYDVPFAEVCDLQIEAMNQRLNEQIDKIKLVALRARDAKITAIASHDDAVPFLLPHTAYKSYPESFLTEGGWDKLTKWLGTVSAHSMADVDLDGVTDVDSWVSRLADAGHYVSCSSGTTGKSAMLVASRQDAQWSAADAVASVAWASGFRPANEWRVFGLSPVADVPHNHAILNGLTAAYGRSGEDRFHYPVPPITVGSITKMMALRKAIAEGTALPEDIADYELTAATREQALNAAIGIAVEALIAARGEKMLLIAHYNNLYKLAAAVRDAGYTADDFHPDNMLYVGGGLKGSQVPDNYKEFVRDTFNIGPQRAVQFYGMQEMASNMLACRQGRYHIPPWLVFLPLNKDAEALLPMDQGEVTCRAGFFELALDGRWGGVISGDQVQVTFEPCKCGARSPSIRDTIVRYKDLEGDDKIGCSGTIDAYVRGVV